MAVADDLVRCAQRFNRLARKTSDPATKLQLGSLADDYFRQAQELRREQTVGASRPLECSKKGGRPLNTRRGLKRVDAHRGDWSRRNSQPGTQNQVSESTHPVTSPRTLRHE